MKEHLLSLDTLNINLGSGEMVVVNLILAFVMFGVALSIRVSTFKSILKKPKSVILGLLLQWFAGTHMPADNCTQPHHHPYGCIGYDSCGIVPGR